MKTGCGCFGCLVGIVGLVLLVVGLFGIAPNSGDQSDSYYKMAWIGLILLGSFILLLLMGASSEDSSDSSEKQEQKEVHVQHAPANAQQTIHTSSGGPADPAPDLAKLNESLNKTLKALDEAKASGGAGKPADPDEPVVVECSGCGAPVTVSPSEPGECEYCGNQVKYRRPK
jgi:hypothetical protein